MSFCSIKKLVCVQQQPQVVQAPVHFGLSTPPKLHYCNRYLGLIIYRFQLSASKCTYLLHVLKSHCLPCMLPQQYLLLYPFIAISCTATAFAAVSCTATALAAASCTTTTFVAAAPARSFDDSCSQRLTIASIGVYHNVI